MTGRINDGMDDGRQDGADSPATGDTRAMRADAQRSVDALIKAARELFATRGVDATTREIADRAGVGMGTLYRRFPRRADLIGGVFREEINDCVAAAPTLAGKYPPFDAFARWTQLYVQLIVTKRGLAKAISTDDPVYVGMAEPFDQLRLAALRLYETAAAAGEVRPDVDAGELLAAISALCMSSYHDKPDHAARMAQIMMDGIRLGE